MHMPAFKAQVALAALCDDRTLAVLATQFELRPTRLLTGSGNCWSTQLRPSAATPRLPHRWTWPQCMPGSTASVREWILERALTQSALLRAKRCPTGPTTSASRGKPSCCRSAGAACYLARPVSKPSGHDRPPGRAAPGAPDRWQPARSPLTSGNAVPPGGATS